MKAAKKRGKWSKIEAGSGKAAEKRSVDNFFSKRQKWEGEKRKKKDGKRSGKRKSNEKTTFFREPKRTAANEQTNHHVNI